MGRALQGPENAWHREIGDYAGTIAAPRAERA
jgi:hypothetical protein